LKDITLEADPDREVVWQLPPGSPDANQVLTINGADGLTLRNFVFDGGGRSLYALVLSGSSPGLALENLKVRGFRRGGILITNCAGGSDRPVTVTGLSANAGPDARAAVYFDSTPNFVPELRRNAYIRINDVRTEGGLKDAVSLVRPNVNDANTIMLPSGGGR